MEALNPSCSAVAQAINPEYKHDANDGRRDLSWIFEPLTVNELSSPTLSELRDVRIHGQELWNGFARLLNRGSHLE